MNSTITSALVRGLVISFLTSAASVIGSYQQGQTLQEALIVGAGVLVTALLVRFGGEGLLVDNKSTIQREADVAKGTPAP